MPPMPRQQVKRSITNENDENAGTTRLTRAKAAALTGNENEAPLKKALHAKKTTTNNLSTAVGGVARKRAALGDVSNVTKGETAESKDGKELKKPLASKTGLVSKAAQPSRIQKSTKTTSSRSILGPKDKNNTAELKRPASGSGVAGPVTKKRHTGSSTKSIVEEEELQETENVAPAVNQKVTKTVKVEVQEAVKIEEQSRQDYIEAPVDDEDTAEYVEDLDKDDTDDPLMVSEYVVEIFEYLREVEISTLANPEYMDQQSELEWKMRGILVDWLLEVHTRFRLLPETLFLSVNIIDRFLSCKIVQLDRLQLVGVTAMFIASKYEEVLSPHVTNFRHVADDGFKEEEILSAERFVLAALDYDLSYPNPMNFLRRISKADNYDIHTRTFGKYLLEISCLDHKFIPYPPSQIAAAAMYMARLVLDRGEWDATITHYAGYSAKEIEPVLELMIRYLAAPVVHEAFFKKYASKKFFKASIICRKWAKDFTAKYGEDIDVDTNARALPLTADPSDSRVFDI